MFSFESIKTSLLKKKALFEDPDFPANSSSLGKLKVEGKVVWKRPKEMNPDAKYVVNKTSRFDLIQGSLADCWFVSAAACLAAEDPALLERCVSSDQSFDKDYAGIFKFSFWNFGSWEEVFIDDRLPTIDGKLVFARNDEEPNEFWVPLFEKAYAKLKGNYGDLDGGQTTYALVDFTGGITERVDLKENRIMSGKLFDVMVAITSKSSLMGCDIITRNGIFEGKLPTGLYTSHAYAITDILTIQSKFGGRPVKLLRVRNPWGEGEWIGDWSDNSPKWNSVSEKDKNDLQLMKKDNGEFWMSFDDWLNNFDYLTICHLEPSSVTAELEKKHGTSGWETISFFAEWIAGYNAGGSSMFSYKREKFFSNPQFRVTLKPVEDHIQNGPPLCHLIVSLMQMTRSWDEQEFIAFDIYQVRNGVSNPGEGKNYGANELTFVKKGNAPVNLREVATHFELPPGDYVVIPFTLEANKNKKFLLRIFVEYKEEGDYNPPTTLIPQKPPTSFEETSVQKIASDVFSKGRDGKKDMDAKELLAVLDQVFKTEGIPNGFTSMEASRCLVSLHGHTQPGLLMLNEFVEVWKESKMWIDKFLKFDTDKSGTIDCYELNTAFVSVGIQLSREAIDAVVGKYGGRQKKLSAGEFILCSCKITHIYEHFKRLSGEGKLKMGLEEWMSMTLTF